MTERFGNAGIIIPPGSVTTDKLASGAVTTDKLASGAVTPDKLGYTAARLFVYRNTAVNITATDTVIVFDTYTYPGFRNDVSEYSVGTGIFEPNTAGYYYIKSSVGILEGLNTILEIRIRTSVTTPGDTIIGYAAAHGRAGVATGGNMAASAAALLYLDPAASPAQDIRVTASATAGTVAALTGPAATNLQIFRAL